MKYTVKIEKVASVDEIEGTWTDQDYIALGELYNFNDAESADPKELKDLLYMAITDYEPAEAARILLTSRLSDHLTEGQIAQISHEMLDDKICEEYPDISLHHEMFHINQLLYKAFNGKFPHARATIVDFTISPAYEVTGEIVLKLFSHALSDQCILKRLFSDQIDGALPFPEAEGIVWALKAGSGNHFTLTTSNYWMAKDDFQINEIIAEAEEYVEEEEDSSD